MNSSLHTEQEDIDEMSGYARARRHAAIKHRQAQQGSWWKTLFAIIITLLLCWWMSGCKVEPDNRPAPKTTIKVIYNNGDSEVLTIDTYPDHIRLWSYKGSNELTFRKPGDQVISTTLATDVRRFEIVSSNYK